MLEMVMSTRKELLENIMVNQRSIPNPHIENVLNQYDMNKTNYDKNPMKLIRMLNFMCGPTQSENIAEIYYDILAEKDLK